MFIWFLSKNEKASHAVASMATAYLAVKKIEFVSISDGKHRQPVRRLLANSWIELRHLDQSVNIRYMNLFSFIWSVTDLLRGKYKPHEYGRVILPFTVLRGMDCVLEPTKQAVLKQAAMSP